MQRIVEPAELTLRPAAFERGLVSWRDPVFLAPLGHQISADAPTGIANGLAAPASGPLPSVQRHIDLPVRTPPASRPARRAATVPTVQRAPSLTAAPPPQPTARRLPVLPTVQRATAHQDQAEPQPEPEPRPPAGAAEEGIAATAQPPDAEIYVAGTQTGQNDPHDIDLGDSAPLLGASHRPADSGPPASARPAATGSASRPELPVQRSEA
ncbi:MAG: hypothetical protein GEV03_22955, partial [Streptosporangiales bacterium]|nr:hypothetical protein [Streptosporangiales bacterium]